MVFLLGSIIVNSLISIIFRSFRKWQVRNQPAIVINYFSCFLFGSLLSGGSILQVETPDNSWWMLLAVLGFTFVIGFNVLARSVQEYSVTIATIVQRMSLILVILFAVGFYDEKLSLLKITGLIIGLTSIFLISGKPARDKEDKLFRYSWLWVFLFLTFLISGGIDSTFLYINRAGISDGQELEFGILLFLSAGVIGTLHLLFFRTSVIKSIRKTEILAGIVLGIPNFLTVYFLQMMLHTGWDGSTIFPISNIGVLILAALLSRLIFKEEFHKMKLIGMLMAILAIVLLSLEIQS